MDYSLPTSAYASLVGFLFSLERHELKPCITLVRYGIIPTRLDAAVWNVLPDSLLDKLFEFRSNCDPIPSEMGELFFKVSTNPLISAVIISHCLATVPTQEEIDNAFIDSASKEVNVMESDARKPTINWKCFFEPLPSGNFVLPHQEKDCSPFVYRINAAFRRFRDGMEFRRIWPHSTSRGISRSGRESLKRLRNQDDISWMTQRMKEENISSLSVVRHYLHTGSWADGVCEMKQRWYPSQLVPRTYFAQGGTAIRVSSYLRNFFNDFTDTFLPCERRARVDGSRLSCPEEGYFFIYDLTSFTSNFHEQKSFLLEMARFFRGTIVFLIGHNLSLIEADIGEMIETYVSEINDFPEYEFNERILDSVIDITFRHHVAGFLGVPGNLVTCTLAHGLAIGVGINDDDRQSTAGDDGNTGVANEREEVFTRRTIHALGTFNDDKASRTLETGRGSYLKRPFQQEGTKGILIDRIDYPLMGGVNCMIYDDPRFPLLSEDRSKLRESIAASVAKLFRDLYLVTKGTFEKGVLEFILAFLKEVYAKAALPTYGMVRKMYGSNLDYESFRIDAAVVFPLNERYFRRDPDQALSEEFLPWVAEVPVRTDEEILFRPLEDWPCGVSRTGQSSPLLEKLVKYGYLERAETERIVLVGEDARRHFRRLNIQDIREQEYTYTSILPISAHQLQSIGLSGLNEYEWRRSFQSRGFNIGLSFRSQPLRDWDAAPMTTAADEVDLMDLY